jgi:hypothetical protein
MGPAAKQRDFFFVVAGRIYRKSQLLPNRFAGIAFTWSKI